MSDITREEFHDLVDDLKEKIIDTVMETDYDITSGILVAAMLGALAFFLGMPETT
jgi:hypothetical protein